MKHTIEHQTPLKKEKIHETVKTVLGTTKLQIAMYVWFHTLQEEVCSKRKACLYVWYVCFTLQLELDMKTTKRSDASGIASPS
jgi:hypothetical protein